MMFLNFNPLGIKTPLDITTTTKQEIQLWQELTMLRHVKGVNSIYARETIAPWIDQAKMYFLDACNSHWKSAGLLYYYSFLNLAKAYIVTNRAVSGRELKSTSIYHGLAAQSQNPQTIVDFTFDIHCPVQRGKKNIFAQFYQKLIGEPWPFNSSVPVKVADIISYCQDISHEVFLFHNINNAVVHSLSVIRDDNIRKAWFEILIPKHNVSDIQNEFASHIYEVVDFSNFSIDDKQFCSRAYDLNPYQLRDHAFIRMNLSNYLISNRGLVYEDMYNKTNNQFKGYALPLPSFNSNTQRYWHFIPKLVINGTAIKWHPLLSNYLFAFVLSTVLRYYPHLFHKENKDAFIAEAWCNQSATTTIRYFLMELSKNNVRIN